RAGQRQGGHPVVGPAKLSAYVSVPALSRPIVLVPGAVDAHAAARRVATRLEQVADGARIGARAVLVGRGAEVQPVRAGEERPLRGIGRGWGRAGSAMGVEIAAVARGAQGSRGEPRWRAMRMGDTQN